MNHKPKGVQLFLVRGVAAAVYLLCFLVPQGSAQQEAQGRPLTENQIINSNQIESFAKALIEIDRINHRYASQLRGGGEEENRGLYTVVEKEMVEAIRGQGLTLPEYHRIAGAVIADETTHERVVQEMTSMQQAAADLQGAGSEQAAQ